MCVLQILQTREEDRHVLGPSRELMWRGAAQERTSGWLVGGRHWGVLCAASGPSSSGSCVSQRGTPHGDLSGAVWGL